MSFGRFLALYLTSFALGAGALVIVNGVVDPNGRTGWVAREGFNAEKTRKRTSQFAQRAEDLRERRYRGLVLGSSRVQLGIPPAGPGLPAKATYNAGLQAARMTDIESLAALARRHQEELEIVVLGVDFFSFSARETEREDVTGDEFTELPRPRFRADLASFETFLRSLATVVDNWRGRAERVLPFGVARVEVAMPEDARHPRTMFENILLRNFLVQPGSYAGFVYGEEQLDALERTLAGFREAGIPVKVFVSPVHARQLEALHQLGLYEEWERWRRDVALRVERVGGPLELWDFAGYTRIHTEPVPDARTPMQWWWESSHYKRSVGKALLRRLFGLRPTPDVPRGFGVQVAAGEMETRHRALRAGRERWAAAFPEEVADVARLVRETAPERSAIPPLAD